MSTAGSGGRAASSKGAQSTAESLWILGFFFFFIAGACLRLRGLTFQSYWDDELFSVALSAPQNTVWQVIEGTATDVHPPLFQLLLWGWFKIFGFTEYTGRLFPALFGVFALPVLYRLGCEVKNRAVGFCALMLCAVNIFHLHYSQEVRSYSLLFFLGSLSLLYFIRLLDEPRRKNLAGWLLVSVAMIYTHFFGVFVLVAQGLALLSMLRHRRELLRPAMIAALVIGVAALPLIPVIMRSADLTVFWIQPPTTDFLLEYFREYFGSALLAATVVLVALYGACSSVADERATAILRVLLLWLAAVLLLPYIRSLVAVPMLTSRNAIVVLPAVFLLAALGIAAIRERVARGVLLFSLFAFSTLQIFYLPPYYRTPSKPQVRDAVQAVIAAHPDADAVYAPADVVANINVYFALYDAPFRARSLAELPPPDGEKPLPQRFWLVDGRAGRALSEPLLEGLNARVVERKDFRNAAFAVLEPAR